VGTRPRPGCLGAAGYSCGASESTAVKGWGTRPPHSKREGFSSQPGTHARHVGNTREGVSSPAHRAQLRGADRRVHVLGKSEGEGLTRGQHPRGYHKNVTCGREVKCEGGRTKGVARPQPRGGKGAAMRGGCCMCMGEAPRSCEHAKFAKNYIPSA